jgi:hypothetical protein
VVTATHSGLPLRALPIAVSIADEEEIAEHPERAGGDRAGA